MPHLVNLAMRNRLLGPYPQRIVSLAEGRVLEIGLGSGLNLPYYTNRATEVLGLEPHPKLLEMASQKSGRVPVKLIEGSAESIPMDAASVDTVVTTWTLCTIPDVAKAARKCVGFSSQADNCYWLNTALRPDEKVRRWQHRLTPVWKRLAGGCHLDRPIADLVESAGFRMKQLQTGYMKGPKPMTFMYEATASPA